MIENIHNIETFITFFIYNLAYIVTHYAPMCLHRVIFEMYEQANNCMRQEERRDDSGRREKVDRRQNGSSMISGYASYSGPERRGSTDRRMGTDRRVQLPDFLVSEFLSHTSNQLYF